MKPLPCACQKQRIYDFFNELSRKEVANEIWEAIMANRKISLQEAKKRQTLYKIEVEAIMVSLGELKA